MTLTSLLRPDRINLDLKAKKKPEALRELVPDIDQHDVYVCGADGWMDAAN